MAYITKDIDIELDELCSVDGSDIESFLDSHEDKFDEDQIKRLAEYHDMKVFEALDADDFALKATIIERLTLLGKIYNEMTVAQMVANFAEMSNILQTYEAKGE